MFSFVFEYKKDPKREDYQNRLRFFMIQPDVIKFLNKKKQPDQNTLKSSKRVVRRKNDYKIKFDQYKELENVIESLKEEQRNELDEIEDEYNEKIQTFQRNFKTNEFKTNPALLLLEEQFRLSMYNKINDLILPN